MAIEALIATMAERLVQQFHPVQVILFGSHARGTATDDSDIDLLVVKPTLGARRSTTVAMRRAVSDLPVCKDTVVTTGEKISRRGALVGGVLHSALYEGRVLYERA